jgi:hypothetical protein
MAAEKISIVYVRIDSGPRQKILQSRLPIKNAGRAEIGRGRGTGGVGILRTGNHEQRRRSSHLLRCGATEDLVAFMRLRLALPIWPILVRLSKRS